MPPLLQVALNGARAGAEHPAIPRTPAELASEARAAVEAGAGIVHLHAYDEPGAESLAAMPCAAALRAVRAVCPGVPVSLTTSAAIEADPERRLALVAGWTELPELVTANQGEAGIIELCEHLIGRGVGIEAGLLERGDARLFVASGLAGRCVRVLVEPLDADPADAVAHAAEMERILAAAGIDLEQVPRRGHRQLGRIAAGPGPRTRHAHRARGRDGASRRAAGARQRRARPGRGRADGLDACAQTVAA